jgi:uncharacterized SAM-binding protein YcdF (DUF218 family)
MFFFLSKTLDLALAPLSWAFLLLIAALILGLRAPERRRRALIVAGLGLGVLVVFSSGSVANRLWWALESSAEETFDPSTPYDVVVLLGGVVERGYVAPGARPSYGDNVERLLVTFDLLRTGQAKAAIISGTILNKAEHPDTEPHVLARQLTQWGIEPERVIIEDRALNTRDNAVEAARLIASRGDKRVLVVTSAFHMPRAMGCFRAVGLKVDSLPVDRRGTNPAELGESILPRAEALELSTRALREFAGRAVYRFQGYSR